MPRLDRYLPYLWKSNMFWVHNPNRDFVTEVLSCLIPSLSNSGTNSGFDDCSESGAGNAGGSSEGALVSDMLRPR